LVAKDVACAAEQVIKLASRKFEAAKPFLCGNQLWQGVLCNYLTFYEALPIQLHCQDPSVPARDFIISGQGTEGDGFELLSETEDEQGELDTSEPTDFVEKENVFTAGADLDTGSQQHLMSRIEYKRRSRRDYKERIRIYGTNIPVPSHYFDVRTSDEIEELRSTVISVLDHEELDEKTNYRCLCDVRRGQKQIDQQVIWLPADSTLLCAYPQSALIRLLLNIRQSSPRKP
jgi:hypothetical protein